MNAFFTFHDDVVTVRMVAEGADMIGDMSQDIRAGQNFAGVSYEDLVAAEAGEIAFDEAGAGSIVQTGAIDAAFAQPQPPEFAIDRDDLAPGHEDVVRWFRGDRAMNEALRGDAAASPQIHDMIRLMHEAVGHGTVTRSGIVYRAVAGADFDIDDVDAKFGHVITWHGFTSTTTDERFARRHLPAQDGVLFRILLPQGSCALQYALLSGRDDPGREVILQAGARFVMREAAGLRDAVEIDLVMLKGPADGKDDDDEA